MSGMARWIVDIQKYLGGEYWTNVYNCLAVDLTDALDFAADQVNRERGITYSPVTFDLVRVRPALAPAGSNVVFGVGQPGLLTLSTGSQLLPLFNCLRVDFRPATGRPSRKYLRGTLHNNHVAAGFNVLSTQRDAYVDIYFTPTLADTRFCDVDGQPFTGGLVFPQIAMRQLRRGSKRPVI